MTASKLTELSIYTGALQKYKELLSLVEFIQKTNSPKVVLEIGTARGGTLWLWCNISDRHGKIISIDLPFGEFGGGYSIEEQNRFATFQQGDQQMFFVRNDSHSPETEQVLIEILGNETIDLLFIDGDHSYDGVREDYYRYGKYVRDEGLVIFHDVVDHPKVKNCKVKKFWDELKIGKSFKEFIDYEEDERGWGQWGGIGVLINKKSNWK
jgi:predicted O-methyltransferase YrrM